MEGLRWLFALHWNIRGRAVDFFAFSFNLTIYVLIYNTHTTEEAPSRASPTKLFPWTNYAHKCQSFWEIAGGSFYYIKKLMLKIRIRTVSIIEQRQGLWLKIPF